MEKLRKRREEISSLLLRGYREYEIAVKLNVSIRTVARDVAFLKKESKEWESGLASDGFRYEYKLAFDRVKYHGNELYKIYSETTDPKLRVMILRSLDENVKLCVQLLEAPTIQSLKMLFNQGNV